MKRFSHKVAYITGGIIIGIVFSTSAGAFAEAVKSMVGKKVTGEYNIVVNGTKLSEKGSVIDSKANVPARSLAEALGATVEVEGKTININSSITNDSVNQVQSALSNKDNKYLGDTKKSLEELRQSILVNILNPAVEGKKKIETEIKELNSFGADYSASVKEKQLIEYDADIAKYEAELKLIDEALLTAK